MNLPSLPIVNAGNLLSRRCALALAAAATPALLAYNTSPSPTFLNQALGLLLWAVWVLACKPARPGKRASPLLLALGLLAAAAVWAGTAGPLAGSLAISAVGLLFAAAVIAWGGAGSAAWPDGVAIFAAFCWAWLIAGMLNVLVACLQVFAPDLIAAPWIAHSSYPGRAVGNLRQPNHLSSLLLWSCIAVIALRELGALRLRHAAPLLAAMVFAVVLSASRTGLLSVLLLALWGLLDRRLSRSTRLLLGAAPLMYLLSWLLMAQWAALSQHTFGGEQRLAESDISSSRFAIWRDTLSLIRMHPWTGVGFGDFNFAWTLSVLPQRPVAFFDHTHNLPLQLLVELGLPLGGLVLALLLWALLRGLRYAWRTTGNAGLARRCAMLMVLMIGLHSMLEYPLWYSYFLLPAAWAWGFALAPLANDDTADGTAAPGPRAHWLTAGAALVVLGAVFSVVDYFRVVAIFTAREGAPPLAQRIADGQRSVFFAHHADYAALTSGVPLREPAHFDRATHYLLDTRLMIAWAQALAAAGQVDEARYLAARLREFRKTDAEEFFSVCAPAPAASAAAAAAAAGASPASTPPFQCEAAQRPHAWRDFLARQP